MERIEPDDVPEPEPDESPGSFERWRKDSALGAVGTGVARGLQAVFAPPANQPVIVASVPGDPPGDDDRVRVILDPDDPTKSVAIVPERTERTERTAGLKPTGGADETEHPAAPPSPPS